MTLTSHVMFLVFRSHSVSYAPRDSTALFRPCHRSFGNSGFKGTNTGHKYSVFSPPAPSYSFPPSRYYSRKLYFRSNHCRWEQTAAQTYVRCQVFPYFFCIDSSAGLKAPAIAAFWVPVLEPQPREEMMKHWLGRLQMNLYRTVCSPAKLPLRNCLGVIMAKQPWLRSVRDWL